MTDEQLIKEPTEEPIDTVKPTEEPEAEPEAEETEEPTEAPTEEPNEAHVSRSQKRIAELVRQREEAQRRAGELESQLAKHEDKDAPKEADFDSYEDYTHALVKHETTEILREERKAQALSQREQDADLALKQFEARAENGRKKHDDFDKVVGNPDLPITNDMLAIMADSDAGDEVAYYLGKNEAETRRLAMMPPAMMGREMARIEMKLSEQPKPALPNPVDTGSTLSGTGESATVDESKMSTEDYIAHRRAKMSGG